MLGTHPYRRHVLQGVTAGTAAILASSAVRRADADDGTDVEIRETNAPVETTDRLEVVCEVSNRSAEPADVDVRLAVGHDLETVDEASVAVDPDSYETVTLGYETASVRRTQRFPVRVEAGDDRDERPVTVVGHDDGGLAALRPATSEVTVQPETAVFFEVAADGSLEPGDVEWSVDNGIGGDLALAYDYTYATGLGSYLVEPDAVGTHDVGAAVSIGAERSTREWTVRVADDGREPPTIERLVTDPGPDAVVDADDTVDVILDAATGDGALDRVIWQEGQNHTVVGVDELDGTDAGVTFTTESPGWIAAGYPTMARVVCEDGRTSAVATADGPAVRSPLSVEVVGTNEPLEGGELLEVVVEVENTGGMMTAGETTQDVELIVGREPERVDTATVTVPAGTTETVTLGYETYPVDRTDEFPVRVESADDADERTVTVSGTGG